MFDPDENGETKWDRAIKNGHGMRYANSLIKRGERVVGNLFLDGVDKLRGKK